MPAIMSQIRQKDNAALNSDVQELKLRLFQLRAQSVAEKLEDSSIIGRTRKEIARVLTILSERSRHQAGIQTATKLSKAKRRTRARKLTQVYSVSRQQIWKPPPVDKSGGRVQDVEVCFVSFNEDVSRFGTLLEEYAIPNAPKPIQFAAAPTSILMPLTSRSRARLKREGAEIFPDVQFKRFDPEDYKPWDGSAGSGTFGTMTDVMDQIRAPQARVHAKADGSGTCIAIVDSGVSPDLKEIPRNRFVGFNAPGSVFDGTHLQHSGHGSMCASIAAASGGRHLGVATGAKLLSARTNFKSSDLAIIFDRLLSMKMRGEIPGPLIVSNSWGIASCTPPTFTPAPGQEPTAISARFTLFQMISSMVNYGITMVFAAGNVHCEGLCKFDPLDDRPNTIWGAGSMDAIMSVGTVNRSGSNTDRGTAHRNSSRGPGEWAKAWPKPDFVCPTYGEVRWDERGSNAYRNMEWWGTSGAAPQVAGLASLILSVRPTLMPADVARTIRDSCVGLGGSANCVGRGMINCEDAVASL